MKTLTVLYVEDEHMLREQILESLKRKFLNVLVAKDGLEGLELYQEHTPDLIISDIKMPNMDGLSMIEKIREGNFLIPIIVMTAYSDLNNLERAIDLDVDRFLKKPTTKKELDSALLKSTLSIIKQKEIDDRDEIIKTILGWNPYFSLICNQNNIQHVSSDFLGISEILNSKNFESDLKNMQWSYDGDLSVNKDISFKNINELLKEIINENNTYYVKLKSNEEYQQFEIKTKYYSSTDLYLVSFFKKDNDAKE